MYFTKLYFYNPSHGCFVGENPSPDIWLYSIECTRAAVCPPCIPATECESPREPCGIRQNCERVMCLGTAKPSTGHAGDIWRRVCSDAVTFCQAEALDSPELPETAKKCLPGKFCHSIRMLRAFGRQRQPFLPVFVNPST